MSNENVAKLAEAVHRYEDEELLCKVVAPDEIRGNNNNLNSTRYVQTDPPVAVSPGRYLSASGAYSGGPASLASLEGTVLPRNQRRQFCV